MKITRRVLVALADELAVLFYVGQTEEAPSVLTILNRHLGVELLPDEPVAEAGEVWVSTST